MRLINKLIKRTGNYEQGFVLIVALMAILILTAIGFFALTMVSGDLMISYRLTGERKALSAAESGALAVFADASQTFQQMVLNPASNCIQVDPTNDPSTCYIVVSTSNTFFQTSGGAGQCTGCQAFIYKTDITGMETSAYNSSVTISIGMVPPPTPALPNIPQAD
jgi:Tfp pilus assembly protein PilX